MLTLKAISKIVADILFYIVVQKIRLWISCVDDSNEMTSLIFYEKYTKIKMSSAAIILALEALTKKVLTLITLWVDSADDKLVTFILIFPENRI